MSPDDSAKDDGAVDGPTSAAVETRTASESSTADDTVTTYDEVSAATGDVASPAVDMRVAVDNVPNDSSKSDEQPSTPSESSIPIARSLDPLVEMEELLIDESIASEQAPSMGSLVRDSAIVLAAATALLYLTSHVFGSEYLSFFEVSGFNSFGVGTLAMIEYGWILWLIVFVDIVRLTLRTTGRARFIAGIGLIVVVSATRPLTILAYGNEVTIDDFGGFIAAAAICVVLTALWKRFGPHFASVEAGLAKTRRLLKRLKEERVSEATREVVLLKNSASYLAHRVWQIRVGTWIASGYITMAFAIPALAWIVAINSAKQERYDRIDQNTPARVPVYWISDRVVFLTFNDGCFVHTQIAGVLQSKRSCGRYIRAVVNVTE